MTTFLQTGYATASSQANYNALMGAIDTHIQSFGWVLTSDTGQTDPGAASLPSSSASSGYRIYRTDDGLANIYLRIDYYRGSTNSYRLDITAGWGTDGAGTLTGNKCTVLSLIESDPAGVQQLAMAGSTNWLTINFATDLNTETYSMAFSIERDLDNTGAPVATGFNVIGARNTHAWYQQYVPSSGTVPGQMTGVVSCHPVYLTSAVIGGSTLVAPAIPIKETGGGNPMLGVAVYTSPNFTNNTTTVVTVYGVSHTYLVGRNDTLSGLSANHRALWRYE